MVTMLLIIFVVAYLCCGAVLAIVLHDMMAESGATKVVDILFAVLFLPFLILVEYIWSFIKC